VLHTGERKQQQLVNLIEEELQPIETEQEENAIMLRRKSDHILVLRKELTFEGCETTAGASKSTGTAWSYWITLN
jgi:hypothetical protein